MYQEVENRITPGVAQVAVLGSGTTEFQFQNRPIRIANINGETLFVARDLAPILGFKNARQAVRTHVARGDRKAVHSMDTPGGGQTLLAVNESGLYALILGSTKPEARQFKTWITAEILPTIRKTGRYAITTTTPLLAQITTLLRGRGAARNKQLNRVIAHRDGTFSLRVGKHWARRVTSLDVGDLPRSHSLRQGVALGALQSGQSIALVQ
jgi:prophage antirepressor-like protein